MKFVTLSFFCLYSKEYTVKTFYLRFKIIYIKKILTTIERES